MEEPANSTIRFVLSEVSHWRPRIVRGAGIQSFLLWFGHSHQQPKLQNSWFPHLTPQFCSLLVLVPFRMRAVPSSKNKRQSNKARKRGMFHFQNLSWTKVVDEIVLSALVFRSAMAQNRRHQAYQTFFWGGSSLISLMMLIGVRQTPMILYSNGQLLTLPNVSLTKMMASCRVWIICQIRIANVTSSDLFQLWGSLINVTGTIDY